MYIVNCNLRKSLGMGRLLNADDGAGNGGEGGNSNTSEGSEGENENPESGKTFTKDDVDRLIQEKLDEAKKGQPSKEELDAFNEWKESQKTEEEKRSEALTNAEKAKEAAEERALLAETKVICLSKGVVADSVDDVVILAKSMVSDSMTMEQAIDKVIEKYPSFKGDKSNENGFIQVGADRGNQNTNINDAVSRAFGNK